MKKHNLWHLWATITIVLLVTACQKQTTDTSASKANNQLELRRNALGKKSSNPVAGPVTVFATGLNNPRELKFGPDGYLYVAEGGTGGTNTTVGQCTQVPFPIGPELGSTTGGRISKISPQGVRTTVTESLPSSQTSDLVGTLISGAADVEFVGNTLYALLSGAGCSHGVPSVPNGIVKVNSDGTWSLVADLSSWLQSHPAAHPEQDDFEPDGTPYSMVNVRGDLYVIEPNHGELLKVTTGGEISRVVDISASQGHIVPTVVAYHGNFFESNLNTYPIQEGNSSIYKITPSGEIKVWAKGFTTVLGIAIDDRNRTYILENTVGADFPTPGLGRIIRIDPSGAKTTIASGLNLPTGLTIGPDGNLYVSNWGFSPAAIGGGQVLKVSITD
jgi:hypothetical protein